MKSISVLCSRLDLFTFSLLILSVGFSQAETSNENAAPLLANVQGGLVVQLGTGDTALPAALGRTGRYIINVLDRDADRVDKARATLREDGVYGLVSAEQIPEAGKLPYAENLVNAIIIQDFTVSAVELRRALTPLGVVLVMNPELLKRQQLAAAGFEVVANTESDGRAAITVRKPWPKGMGTWSHPRHGADGNAVSDDTLVGPPRRVWMTFFRRVGGKVVVSAFSILLCISDRISYQAFELLCLVAVEVAVARFFTENSCELLADDLL